MAAADTDLLDRIQEAITAEHVDVHAPNLIRRYVDAELARLGVAR